jgi:hypothetical protein
MRTLILSTGISMIVIGATALDTSSGCTPAQVATDIDLINAECALLDSQPGAPIAIIIGCEVFNAAQQIIQQFNVKVPADQAAAFIAAHPVKSGHPLPAGASGAKP